MPRYTVKFYRDQLDELGDFIAHEFPKDITQGGSVDVAIEILTKQRDVINEAIKEVQKLREAIAYTLDNLQDYEVGGDYCVSAISVDAEKRSNEAIGREFHIPLFEDEDPV